jgi:ABC-type transporter MlaC component
VLEQSNGIGQFEALRTTDIQTDANSAASQAFNALKDNRPKVRSDEKKKIVD